MTTDTLALPRTETDTRPGTPPPVWLKKEDSWAIVIGLGLVIATTVLFLAGGSGITSCSQPSSARVRAALAIMCNVTSRASLCCICSLSPSLS